jgi:hypothetical protein
MLPKSPVVTLEPDERSMDSYAYDRSQHAVLRCSDIPALQLLCC